MDEGEHEPAPARVIDLEALEIEDGPALARLVTKLKRESEQGPPLVLVHCPQMLAHTLYKAGVLGAGRIRIGSMREEEPYAP
jgi:anti-anti-sigma regulatory factor